MEWIAKGEKRTNERKDDGGDGNSALILHFSILFVLHLIMHLIFGALVLKHR